MRSFARLVALLSALAIAGATNAQDGARAATFLPLWVPQSQFAGYYIAAEQGFYRQRGIEVKILPGGPERVPSEWVERGDVDFALLWLSTAIQLRARGVPVVNLAQVTQRSALMLVAKKSSGIHTPQDLNNKKIAVWAGDFMLQPTAFFNQYGLTVQTVPLAATINLFMRDGVQATTAMWYNEYHSILNAGLDPDELVTFLFAEHGLNFPEDGIYCREETLRTRPGLARAFVEASLAGWEYAFAHPDSTVATMMRYRSEARFGTNRPHQEWMLKRMRDLILPEGTTRPGVKLERQDYNRVAKALVENGLITTVPKFEALYRPFGEP